MGGVLPVSAWPLRGGLLTPSCMWLTGPSRQVHVQKSVAGLEVPGISQLFW